MPSPNPAVRYSHSGNALITDLAAPITAVSTSLTISNPAGWPDGSLGPFFIVVSQGKTNVEKILIASRTGSTLAVNGGVAGRGQDGTSAADHAAGEPNSVYPCITAFEIDLLNAHAAAINAVHGVAGNVLGTSDAQNVANKTLDSTNSYAGGTLSGTFTGSPTYSGNPTFSGTPVFSGNPNFTGAPTLTNFTNAPHDHGDADDGGGLVNPSIAGAALSGTITGSPTLSGAPVFSGVPEFTADALFRRANATDEALGTRLNADGSVRLRVQADGKLVWSDGAGALDTNLFRDAANVLRTNDSLTVDADLVAGTPSVKQNKPPRGRIYKSAVQSINNNAYTALTFNSEDFDSAGQHDTATNNSRVTPNKVGLYFVKGQYSAAANSTGHRDAKIVKNGTTPQGFQQLQSISGVVTIVQVSAFVNCNGSTDYFELEVRQNSGAALDAQGGAIDDCHLEWLWVADDATSN